MATRSPIAVLFAALSAAAVLIHGPARAGQEAPAAAANASAPLVEPGCPGPARAGYGCGGPQDRGEHMRRMSSFKSWEECRAYMDDWRTRHPMMHGPRGASMPMADNCAGLPRHAP